MDALLLRLEAAPLPGLAKHARLSEAIRRVIESGYWRPGARLPTEAALAQRTPFSLGTVQHALRSLAEEGLIERRHGSGTFVAEGRRRMDAPWHCRFLDESSGELLPIYPRAVGRATVRERGPWSDFLVQRSDGDVLRIDRLIRVGDEFTVFSHFYANRRTFGEVLERPLRELHGTNFKTLLVNVHGLPITGVRELVSVGRFPPAVLRRLALLSRTVGVTLEAFVEAGRARPLYYQVFFIPPNARKLVVYDGARHP
jgi:DNA-binding GntR family transcriptional regulator